MCGVSRCPAPTMRQQSRRRVGVDETCRSMGDVAGRQVLQVQRDRVPVHADVATRPPANERRAQLKELGCVRPPRVRVVAQPVGFPRTASSGLSSA